LAIVGSSNANVEVSTKPGQLHEAETVRRLDLKNPAHCAFEATAPAKKRSPLLRSNPGRGPLIARAFRGKLSRSSGGKKAHFYMTRREFITLVGGAAFAVVASSPLAAVPFSRKRKPRRKRKLNPTDREITPNPTPPSAREVARRQVRTEAASVFRDALAELPESTRSASEKDLYNALREAVARLAKAEADKPNPRWKFEASTGKLTVNVSARVASGEIGLGDINLYQVAYFVAAAVAGGKLCGNPAEWVACVEKAIKDAISAAEKDEKRPADLL
jgi:hypothetical protein